MLQVAPIPQPLPDKLPDDILVKEEEPEVSTVVEEEVVKVTELPASPPSLLEALTPLDRLYITRRLRIKRLLYLRGKKNQFSVRTPDQTLVYKVEEENRWWVGYLFYGLRPLELKISNEEGSEIIRIKRPFACTARVLPCQLQHMDVYSPPGNLIGTIDQEWTVIRPLYTIKNSDGDELFIVYGPKVTLGLFKDVQFHVTRTSGEPVGATCKRWQGLMHAVFRANISDSFGVAFERALTVEEKALLLAATLLISYMYYDI